MTNEELVQIIQAGNDPGGQRLLELWDMNSGIIHKACGKYAGYIEHEDAAQECFFAFVAAVNEYDSEKGSTFAGYLLRRCRWHLDRYTMDQGASVRIPANRQGRILQYRRFVRQWYQVKGEYPADYVICFSLGLNEDQLNQLRVDLRALEVASLDAPLSSDDPDGETAADHVHDSNADPVRDVIEETFDQERRRAVWSAVDDLEPAEGEAIRAYYQGGMTYEQAGDVMGVSRERIRSLIAKGIRKLRTQKRFKVLREFVDLSPVYGRGLQGSLQSFNRTWTSATEKTALHLLEMEERWKREREELDRLYERNRRDMEERERRKAARTAQ